MTALTPLPVPLPVFFSVLICNYNYADFVGLAIQSVLVGVSCNDIRLASASGSLVHADVLRNSGAWKQNLQQVPPLATALKDWVAPPMSACMFRRSAFLDRLFDSWEMVPPDLQNAGFWLVFQLQHHTSGVLRILETLTTCRLPDGAAASYGYLSAPSGIDATLQPPPIAETVAWLGQFYQREQALSESKPCLAAGCRPPGTSALCRGWRRSKIEDWPPDCIKAVTRHDNGVTKNNSKLSIQDVGICHICLFFHLLSLASLLVRHVISTKDFHAPQHHHAIMRRESGTAANPDQATSRARTRRGHPRAVRGHLPEL